MSHSLVHIAQNSKDAWGSFLVCECLYLLCHHSRKKLDNHAHCFLFRLRLCALTENWPQLWRYFPTHTGFTIL